MSTSIEVFHIDNQVQKLDCVPMMSIGRDKTNLIQLKDPMVSRNHAIINCLGKDYYLMDTGSRNGVYINGRRISAPVQLKHNDEMTVGDTKILFQHIIDANELNSTTQLTNTDFNETMHSMKANIRSVIVLVSDIRGFTTMSESIPIETLTKVMSVWFQEIQKIVEKNFGVVDKFLGDCVLAKWEVERNDSAAVPLVLQTALDIADYTSSMKDKFPDLEHDLRVGCGINAGTAAVGIGLENTIIGDVVNTAFRLETASKSLDRDIVFNSSFYLMHPDEDLRIIQEIKVKGKNETLKVSALTYDELRLWLRMHPAKL